MTSVYWTQHRAVRGQPTELIERCLNGSAVLHEELHLPVVNCCVSKSTRTPSSSPIPVKLKCCTIRSAKPQALHERNVVAVPLTCIVARAPSRCASRLAARPCWASNSNPTRWTTPDATLCSTTSDNARFIAGDVGKVLAGELRKELTSYRPRCARSPSHGLGTSRSTAHPGHRSPPPGLRLVQPRSTRARPDRVGALRLPGAVRSSPWICSPNTAHIECVYGSTPRRIGLVGRQPNQPPHFRCRRSTPWPNWPE